MTEIKDESIMQVNEAYNKPPIDSNDVYSVFKKWLYLPSVSIIDVIFGTILANRIPGDPVWLFLVAPPGGGKSEPLRALTDCPGIKVLSTLTPHTLISGMGREDGKDASLIPLLNNNVLIIKDFTPILNMPLVNRDEILSILRDAFDGECAKPFGNGVWKKYKSVFGIIAAVTPVIEAFTEESASVGERFLRWKNDIPLSFKLRTKYVEKAYENLTHEKEMRDELHKITERVLQSNYSIIPELPSAMQSKITKLSLLLEVLRSCVVRDRYTKDILHMPFVGVATRLSKELIKLAYGISQFKQLEVVSIDVYKILVHVVKSSVTKRSIDLLEVIYKNNGKLSLSDCKNYTKLPTITCQLIFDNFVVLNIVKKEVNDNKISYKLMPDINDIIKLCQLFD